eukprot:766521-Hanusia_phi.AAC.4
MSADPKKRVVVTGLGVMSGLGQELGEFWGNLVDGKTSIARVSHFDPSDFTCQIASQVGDFTPGDFFANAKTAKSNDR